MITLNAEDRHSSKTAPVSDGKKTCASTTLCLSFGVALVIILLGTLFLSYNG